VTRPPKVDPATLALVRGLQIDEEYLRSVVDRLSSIGSSPLGFRTTGTPEDAAVADFVAAEMRAMGLADVAVEDVEVDGWRFLGASLQIDDVSYEGSSFGGVGPTPAGGVTGRLVDVGTGRRRELAGKDLAGAIALVDWRTSNVSPFVVALELAEHGVVGMVLNCPTGGPWYQSPDALGAFDGHWPAAGPPMIFIRKEDAVRAREALARGPVEGHLTLNAEVTPRTQGHNVVGYLPGDRPGPIVVGAHHDGWFHGAFDDASGVASLLALAKALMAGGHRLPYDVCFSTRTGEEYGILDSSYDWCIGAWEQVHTTHPEWSTQSPFHLCMEANGRPELRVIVETTVELAAWSRQICRVAAAEGWLPSGWRVAPPVSGTELWPFLVSGVPSVAAYYWEKSFGKTDYHTQLDTAQALDFSQLVTQTRLYGLMLVEAARDPDAIIDHGARTRDLVKLAGNGVPPDHELVAAATRHAASRGRGEFTRIGQGLVAVDAHGGFCYPHVQAAADVRHLEAALSALDRDDQKAASRSLTKVGSNQLFPYLSEPAFAAYSEREKPAATDRSWAKNSHVTSSPDLWAEIAALTGDAGAKPPGKWLRESLLRSLEHSRHDLDARLTAMVRAVEPTDPSTG
jgi:hypothetical protein